jgi:hypothetical protein
MIFKEVLRSITNALKAEGFRTSRGILLRPICPGFETFVGLNTATHRGDGFNGINPVIGLRDVAIEDLLTELHPVPGQHSGPTLSTSLGYLTPERKYIEWLFGESESAAADQLLASIRKYGYPAMESLASHGTVLEALEKDQMTYNISRAYRLPVGLLIEGKKDSAIEVVHREMISIGDRNDEAAEQYRAFAESLERRVGVGPSVNHAI